jgi:hypothetical protein
MPELSTYISRHACGAVQNVELQFQDTNYWVVRASQATPVWGVLRKLHEHTTAVEWHCTTCSRALFIYTSHQVSIIVAQ